MEWTEQNIQAVIDEMQTKLHDCRAFLQQKRLAYQKFDRYEGVSANPYSMHARTLDSRDDHYIVQFLDTSERFMPRNVAELHSLQDLLARRREIINFWTDLWEAVNRAEARASLAEKIYHLEREKNKNKKNSLNHNATHHSNTPPQKPPLVNIASSVSTHIPLDLGRTLNHGTETQSEHTTRDITHNTDNTG